MIKYKFGQAWIETVVYTLIMLSIIGIVLAVARPALQQKQDKLFIEQSIAALNIVDSNVEELIVYGVGNTREVPELGIKKGKFTINSPADKIEFEIDSKYAYSQPGKPVKMGKIDVLTEKKSNYYLVKLSIPYKGESIDITYNGKNNDNKTLTSSPTPYTLFIRNANYTNNLYQIDFSLA